MYELRQLTENDASSFFAFRLAALEQSPESFGESSVEWRATAIETIIQRLHDSSSNSFVMGAFHKGQLIGTVGFYREPRHKLRHKGKLWGVYVDPAFRRHGIARALIQTVVSSLLLTDGLLQVSLSVASHQTAAVALYDSLGFTVYGLERRALQIDTTFIDEQHRVLFLDKAPTPAT